MGRAKPQAQFQNVFALLDLTLTLSCLAVGLCLIFGIAALADLEYIDGVQLRMVLSFVCPAVLLIQFIAPTPVVVDALLELDVRELPIPVFQSQSACNILAISYAIQVQNEVILASNLIGLACQVIFLSASHYVLESDKRWVWYTLRMQVIYSVSLYVFAAVIPLELLGQMMTFVYLVLYSAPLAKVGTILRTQNAASLPTAMTVVSTFSNAVWSLYALLIKDVVVLIPCLLGFVLCSFQVLVLLWCSDMLPFDLSFLLLPCPDSSIAERDPNIAERQVPEDVCFGKTASETSSRSNGRRLSSRSPVQTGASVDPEASLHLFGSDVEFGPWKG